jgi:hypothetical protein
VSRYPTLYTASDAAAAAAERAHLRTVVIESTLAVSSVLLGSLAAARLLPVPAATTTAVLLAVSVIVSWTARARRWEKLWFDSRAVAESAKSAAWRYMACATPFGAGAASADAGSAHADADLVDLFRVLLAARPEVGRALAAELPASPQAITEEMRVARQGTLAARRQAYLTGRLRQQLDWYAAKARHHARRESTWFGLRVATQLAALVAAVWFAVEAARPGGAGPFTPVPALAAAAGAMLAWTRTRRYADLANAYGLASQELAGLESVVPAGEDPAAFSDWVGRVEAAISREHSMWLGQRGPVQTELRGGHDG